MVIGIGCDHGGFTLKQYIQKYLKDSGYDIVDYGSTDGLPCNYPNIAGALCNGLLKNEFERGILVCGTGIGMSIAANKFKGVRAAVVSDHFSTRYTRLHNDSNIICLGERTIGLGIALELIDIFLSVEFEGGRHRERIDLISELEN